MRRTRATFELSRRSRIVGLLRPLHGGAMHCMDALAAVTQQLAARKLLDYGGNSRLTQPAGILVADHRSGQPFSRHHDQAYSGFTARRGGRKSRYRVRVQPGKVFAFEPGAMCGLCVTDQGRLTADFFTLI